ncbi:MAG: hypothetical protein ACXW2T_05060, partial [Allosphingosinicella sp.]
MTEDIRAMFPTGSGRSQYGIIRILPVTPGISLFQIGDGLVTMAAPGRSTAPKRGNYRMKSVLLHASEDSGFESRFQAALDHVRRFDGHLTCLQVTPFDAFVMADPFGGVYALPVVMERLREKDDSHRGRIEERLRAEGVNWDWIHHDGAPAQMLVARSGLSDLIVTSLPAKGNDGPLSLTADVAVHARTPVLAVPPTPPAAGGTDVVMVAWNGSQEAAHALRLTLD